MPPKPKTNLGWAPTYTLNQLVREMVASDIDEFKREKHLMTVALLSRVLLNINTMNKTEKFMLPVIKEWLEALLCENCMQKAFQILLLKHLQNLI